MSSQYGVREGNILKLELRLEATSELVALFDHEWRILPDDENIHGVIDSLVYHYEASEQGFKMTNTTAIAAVLEPSMKAEVKEKNKDLIAFGMASQVCSPQGVILRMVVLMVFLPSRLDSRNKYRV